MTKCGIHGEVCEVTGTDSSSNDCCGEVKYMCESVSISLTVDDTRCCMPLGAKGCSESFHCCGEDIGNRCEDSRCVNNIGEFPDDSHGTREVSTTNWFVVFYFKLRMLCSAVANDANTTLFPLSFFFFLFMSWPVRTQGRSLFGCFRMLRRRHQVRLRIHGC